MGRRSSNASMSSAASAQAPMSLMDRLGGVAGTGAILDEFCKRVEQDEQLFIFFKDTKVTFFRLHQLKLFRLAMDNGIGRDSSAALIQNHWSLLQHHGLSIRHFDLMIHHLLESLNACHVEESLYRDASDELWSFRGAFVHGFASAQTSQSKSASGSLQTMATEEESVATSNNSQSTGTSSASKSGSKFRRRISNLFRARNPIHRNVENNDLYAMHDDDAMRYSRVKRNFSGDASVISEISEISGPSLYPHFAQKRRVSTGGVNNVSSSSADHSPFPMASVQSSHSARPAQSLQDCSIPKSQRRLSTGCMVEESTSKRFTSREINGSPLRTPRASLPVQTSKEQRHAQWTAMVAELAARTKAEKALQHIQLEPCPRNMERHGGPSITAAQDLDSLTTSRQRKRFSLSGAARRFSNGSNRASRRRSSNGGSSGGKAVRRLSNGLKSRFRGDSDTSRRRASMSGMTRKEVPQIRLYRRASTGYMPVSKGPIQSESPIPFPSSPKSRAFLKQWSVSPLIPLPFEDNAPEEDMQAQPQPMPDSNLRPKLSHLYFE